MEDEEQVRILKENGVEAWNNYVEKQRERDGAWFANLRDADLSRADLSRADLSRADLSRAKLNDADLRIAELSDADLSRADLSRADLSDAKLNDADLRRAKLNDADLRRAYLSGAKLRDADLRRAYLSGAKLRDADLSDAKLNDADLSYAILRRAHLSGAKLNDADLNAADLNRADLRNAKLNSAGLIHANLTRTNLGNANLGNAILAYSLLVGLDLEVVNGLEKVRCLAPSSVGIDTLYKSKGKIPDGFLRGCGVPDEFITYARGLVGGPAFDFYSCFISYSHADKAFAGRLHDQLQGRGIRCWLDEHELLPGDPIPDQIDRGIRLWDKVLVCCSEASLGFSAWVDVEVEKALQKEADMQKDRGKRVHALIPLNLDNYLFKSWKSGMASVLKGRLAADFTGWETDNNKFEEQFEKVVKALQTDDTGREPPPTPKQ